MPQSQLIYEMCLYCNNFFVNKDTDIHAGMYKIQNGAIYELYDWDSLDLRTGLTRETQALQNGQYFRIVGSVLNDGVYKYPVTDLTDEIFDGAIWAMRLPPAFIALASEIEQWQTANADAINSPYQSESFGGYSYSKRTGADGDGGALTWQTQFKSRLNRWRRTQV